MEILTNFGIQPILLLAQIVNFLIILYLLKRFFYGPISKVLEDRKKRIDQSLKNAQLIEEKLAATETKTAQILKEAQNNATNIISEAKQETERIMAAAQQDARQLAQDQLVLAKDQIQKAHAQMQKELERDTLTLVAQVVQKILGRTLSTGERRRLTDKATDEIQRIAQ